MFTLPQLPYAYDALAPYIDARTMKLHHTKHHQGYVDKLNQALKAAGLEEVSLEALFQKISTYPAAIRNHGGGHYNHTLFWTILSPDGQGTPHGALARALQATFGSVTTFKEAFSKVAATHFGAGWVWLCVDARGSLQISATPNQDNPLMEVSIPYGTPILGLDVWEHAYYLKYQNRRADYIEAFWQVVDWDAVQTRYEQALASVKPCF